MSESNVRAPSPGESTGVPIGEWNHAELAIGKRGMGKSTILLERMDALDDEAGGAYKIGHSPEPRFPKDATRTRINYYTKIDTLDKGLHRHPDEFHCWISEEADPIVAYAKQLGVAVRKRALGMFNRDGLALGRPAVPVILIVDELAFLSGAKGSAQGSDKSDWFRRFLISLRHHHVAFLGGIQDANSIAYVNASLADRLWAFRVSHAYALQALRAAGAPQEQLDRLPKLGVGEYEEIIL